VADEFLGTCRDYLRSRNSIHFYEVVTLLFRQMEMLFEIDGNV